MLIDEPVGASPAANASDAMSVSTPGTVSWPCITPSPPSGIPDSAKVEMTTSPPNTDW